MSFTKGGKSWSYGDLYRGDLIESGEEDGSSSRVLSAMKLERGVGWVRAGGEKEAEGLPGEDGMFGGRKQRAVRSRHREDPRGAPGQVPGEGAPYCPSHIFNLLSKVIFIISLVTKQVLMSLKWL